MSIEDWQIVDWQDAVHGLAIRSGWHDGELTQERLVAMLALVHTEVSEAVHCVRDGDMTTRSGENGKPEGLPIELADIALRVLCVAAWAGIDLQAAMIEKHEYNKLRGRGTVLKAGTANRVPEDGC